MKYAALVLVSMFLGCTDNEVHTQTTAACDGKSDEAIISAPLTPPVDDGLGGAGGSGGAGVGGAGGGSPLRADGASCDENQECENSYCVPSKNSFGSGVCFSDLMYGCILVTEPSPFAASCGPPFKSLFVCGDYDVSLLGTCTVAGTGDIGEQYHCCNKL